MSWRLGNSIRLILETGLELLENLGDDEDINRTWENRKE
jgi:hypothetical protein